MGREMKSEIGNAFHTLSGLNRNFKKTAGMLNVFPEGMGKKLLPIIVSAFLALSTAAYAKQNGSNPNSRTLSANAFSGQSAPLAAGIPQIGPNPNNNTIDTPLDPAMPPVPNPPAVTSSNAAGAIFTNNGTVNLLGSFDNNGTINNNGTMTDILQCINHNNNAGAVWNNNAGAHMDIGNGRLNNAAGATFNNYGDFNTGGIGGSIINYGTITNHAGGYYLNGVLTLNYNTFVNNGTYEGWTFHNYAGTVTNNGTWIHHSGMIDNAAGAIFNNNGTMTTNSGYSSTSGIYNNGGTFNNNNGAVITNGSGVTSANRAGGIFNNAGSITNNGTFNNEPVSAFINSGMLANSSGAAINNSGALNIAAGGSLNNAGTLNNTGRLEFASGSSYDFTGGTFNNNIGGTLALYRNFNFGDAVNGRLNLKTGSTLQNYAVLINPGGNSQANDGDLVNNAGAIFMNNGAITGSGGVNNYGLLLGNGTFSGNVTNSGTIAPGTSMGTMTIGGNFTSSPGSVYEVEVDATGQSDKLNVTGSADLKGGTVSVLGAQGAYALRTSYTILTAGSLLGEFASVTDNLTFLDSSLSYDSQNVYLILTRNDTRFGDAVGPGNEGLTPNQKAVADSLDVISPIVARIPLTGTSDMRSIINAIIPMAWSEYTSALDQMGGLVHTTIGEVTFSSFNRYMGAMNSRMGGFIAGRPSMSFAGQQPVFASRTGNLSAGNTLLAAMGNSGIANSPAWGLWGQGYGNIGDRRGTDISSRYNYNTAGGVIGFDRHVSSPLLLGLSIGYSQGDVRMKDLSEKADIWNLRGSLYGVYTSGPWYVSSVLAYGFNNYDTERDMAFGGLSRKATADYNAHTMGAFIEGGLNLKAAHLDIIPSASLTASHIIRESFNEEGAGVLSLNAEEEKSSYMLSSLGVKFMKECASSWGVVTPEFKVRWDHRLTGDLFALNAAFNEYPNAFFTTRGDMPYRDLLGVGAGVSLLANNNMELRLAYEGSFSGDNTEHGGTLSFRYLW